MMREIEQPSAQAFICLKLFFFLEYPEKAKKKFKR